MYWYFSPQTYNNIGLTELLPKTNFSMCDIV